MKTNKKNSPVLLITVDTEGDCLWDWKEGQEITTRNTAYIPRFQELCEKYGFKPVYFTNLEMAEDKEWVAYSGAKALEGKCEIGLHLHAWNTPPFYHLESKFGGNPYITEYPADIMEEKVRFLSEKLQDAYGFPIVSHRAGRWATNETYFSALKKNGIRYDASFTPGLDLSGIPGCSAMSGSNYAKVKNGAYLLKNGMVEVAMTTELSRIPTAFKPRKIAKAILKGNERWLRPVTSSAALMKKMMFKYGKKVGFAELMVHSSELMPGGSPYAKTKEDIEALYVKLEEVFKIAAQAGFCGATIKEYGEKYVATERSAQ